VAAKVNRATSLPQNESNLLPHFPNNDKPTNPKLGQRDSLEPGRTRTPSKNREQNDGNGITYNLNRQPTVKSNKRPQRSATDLQIDADPHSMDYYNREQANLKINSSKDKTPKGIFFDKDQRSAITGGGVLKKSTAGLNWKNNNTHTLNIKKENFVMNTNLSLQTKKLNLEEALLKNSKPAEQAVGFNDRNLENKPSKNSIRIKRPILTPGSAKNPNNSRDVEYSGILTTLDGRKGRVSSSRNNSMRNTNKSSGGIKPESHQEINVDSHPKEIRKAGASAKDLNFLEKTLVQFDSSDNIKKKIYKMKQDKSFGQSATSKEKSYTGMHNFNIFNGNEKPKGESRGLAEKLKLGNMSANISVNNEKGLYSYSSKNAVKLNQGIDFTGVPSVHSGPTSTKHADKNPNLGNLNSNYIIMNKQKN
jgi:hypothetical protein